MIDENGLIPRQTSSLPPGPWLVFASHPHNETFGIGGAIVLATKQGTDVTIAFLADGSILGKEDEESLAGSQVEKARIAARLLGVRQTLFLGEKDGTLRRTDGLIARLAEQIKEIRPASVFFPSPLEPHPDHRTTARLVWAALQRCEMFTGRAFAYELSVQSRVNRLIDITEVQREKRAAMEVYRSRRAEKDYIGIVEALDGARTYTLPAQVERAEGLYEYDSQDLSRDLDFHTLKSLRPYWQREIGTQPPLVSVIIRTKNRPHLLREALQSVAEQTYPNIELVVVNDGGEDVEEIINEFRGTAQKCRYVMRDDGHSGRAAAANAGLDNATGEYLNFLDDDDLFDPDHIASLMDVIAGNPSLRIVYSSVRTEGAGEGRDMVFSNPYDPVLLRMENNFPIHAILFDKRLLKSGCRFDESLAVYEDWDFWLQLSSKSSFHHVDLVSATYRSHGDSGVGVTPASIAAIKEARAALFEKWRLRWTGREVDEIFTAISQKNAEKVHSLNQALDKSEQVLRQQEDRLRQAQQLAEAKDVELAELRQLAIELAELRQLVEAKDAEFGQLSLAKDAELAEVRRQLEAKHREIIALQEKSRQETQALGELRKEHDLVLNSTSWYLTRPLRTANQCRRNLGAALEANENVELSKKAYSVLKTRGLGTFLRYMHKYIVHGKGYFEVAGGQSHVRSDTSNETPSKDAYDLWIEKNEKWDEKKIRKEIDTFGYTPRISILTPVYNVDPRWLDRCIESVRSQYYENWELCLHDDASGNPDTVNCLKKWNGRDERIKVSFGDRNGGISEATNQAFSLTTGEFVALLDNDDELSPAALFEVVKTLNEDRDLDLIYSDEDRIAGNQEGDEMKRSNPFFKPDWSPHLLFACMYTGHLSVYRRTLVDGAGRFRSPYDFSQDYDLALRITERTERIRHIPKVLYHWREVPGSAAAGGKDYARASNIGALESAVERRGYDAEVLEYPFANRVRFRTDGSRLVSIIIPTDSKKNALRCIDLLLANTDYRNFEIIIVTNSTLGEEIRALHNERENIKIRIFDKPFNFSQKCNDGAATAVGDYLLFFNDDVEAIDRSWLDDMVGVFGKGNVGGVSPKLFYENDTIQYAGMVTGVRGFFGTAFHCQPKDSCAYFNFIQSERNVTLLSGACLLIPKGVFDEVGGFDAIRTPIMHSDADLCFRLLEKGYELIYTPFAALRHVGHLSLREVDVSESKKRDKTDTFILKKWGDYLGADPFYTSNMRSILYQGGDVPYKLVAGRQDAAMLDAKDLLLVTHDLSLSGAPILLYYLACYLKDRGYFVTVMSPFDGELADKYREKNIPVMIDATISGHPHSETRKIMGAFDLIVANTVLMWPSVIVAKESGIPAVWITHESQAGRDFVVSNKEARKALRMADDVIFACNATASLYKDFGDGGNYRIINYGARPLDMGDSQHQKNGKFVILHIGSIEQRKGQDILIESIRRLPKSYKGDIEVWFVGRVLKPGFYEEVRNAAKAYDNIFFLGEVPHQDIGQYYSRADLFVCSSRDEVFPLTILEAMSAGKPIISTDVGGISEMINNNTDGTIVPPDDPGALSAGIIRLFDDREMLGKLGANAKRRFYQDFTVEKFGENIMTIVGKRLDGP
jgi:glycosyltransferase involved in cell wall biosynthesis/LmbE family N-acetylglucosaminyl deacetylase